MEADKRKCFICYGSGKLSIYDEHETEVVGKEDCYQCNGSGEIDDVCYCNAYCECECSCGYDWQKK